MFRGFTDKWIYGFPYINELDILCIITDWKVIPVKDDSLTLDTGFKDINNISIYVGDIVKYGINGVYEHIAVIKYSNGMFVATGPFGLYSINDSYLKNMQIIGNHIENPEIIDSIYKLTEEFERTCFLNNTTYNTI